MYRRKGRPLLSARCPLCSRCSECLAFCLANTCPALLAPDPETPVRFRQGPEGACVPSDPLGPFGTSRSPHPDLPPQAKGLPNIPEGLRTPGRPFSYLDATIDVIVASAVFVFSLRKSSGPSHYLVYEKL